MATTSLLRSLGASGARQPLAKATGYQTRLLRSQSQLFAASAISMIPSASLFPLKQLHGIDLELQHACRVAAVVAAFALQGDATEFQVAGFGDFDRAVAEEFDGIRG